MPVPDDYDAFLASRDVYNAFVASRDDFNVFLALRDDFDAFLASRSTLPTEATLTTDEGPVPSASSCARGAAKGDRKESA
jgi:hypothetical protein